MKSKRILLFLVILALMLGVWRWHASGRISSSSARVQADSLLVSPRIDGYVMDVLVREGDRVKAGQVLLRLDHTALQTALAREEAKLALLGAPPQLPHESAVHPGLTQIRKDETTARQEVERLSTFQASAAFELARLRSRAAGAEALRRAEENDRAARDVLAGAKDRLEDISGARARIEQQRAAIHSAGADPEARPALQAAQEATVRQARQDLDATEIKAPADGTVRFRDANAGQMLRRGDKTFVLLPSGPGHTWINAVFPKAAASRLRPGQPCAVTVEGYSGPELPGTIGGIVSKTEEDGVSVRVTLSSYDPAVMPPLPADAKARVTVDAGADVPGKNTNAAAAGGKNASRR